MVISLDNDLYPVVNIRLRLKDYRFGKKFRKIKNRNDRLFKTVIKPLELSPEMNDLYQAHITRFKGFVHDDLERFLQLEFSQDIFHTHMVCVYDDTRLVGLSFFDMGKNAIASILGLYDHDYAKYSLGHYTMIKEVEHALSQQLQYFYPGYILMGHDSFDYKLRLGKMQYYNWKGRWRDFDHIDQEDWPGIQLSRQMDLVEQGLHRLNVPCKRMVYPYFPMGYLFADVPTVKSPFVLVCGDTDDSYRRMFAVMYDYEEGQYVFGRLAIDDDAWILSGQDMSLMDQEHCLNDILVQERLIAQSASASQIVKVVEEKWRLGKLE